MKKSFVNNLAFAAVLMLIVMSLTACGKSSDADNSDKSSIEIRKDGTVISTIAADFAESYYSTDELKEMTENEINAFVVSNGEDSASFESIDSKDGKVRLVIKFGSASDYAHFNDEMLLYETVSDAVISGQIDVNSLVDKDGNTIEPDKADSLSSQHVVICASKGLVSVPYKIRYASNNIKLIDKKTADFSGLADDASACLVLDK